MAVGTQPHQSNERRRTITTAACQGCRIRKTKCNGARPCSTCVRRGIACEFDTEPHESRQHALKRKCAALEHDVDDKERLIQLLTTSSEEEALRVLHCVRSGTDLSTIVGRRRQRRLASPIYTDVVFTERAPSLNSQLPLSPISTSSAQQRPPTTSRSSISSHSGPDLSDHGSNVSDGLLSTHASPKEMRLSYICNSPNASQQRKDSFNLLAVNGTSSEIRRSSSCSGIAYSVADRSGRPDNRPSNVGSVGYINPKDWGVDYLSDSDFADALEGFLTSDAPASTAFDGETFLQGLAARGSEFCTELLVHCVLAVHLHYYQDSLSGWVTKAKATAVEHALALWEHHEADPIPATLAAGLLLDTLVASEMHTSEPTRYFKQAARIGMEAGFYDPERVAEVYAVPDLAVAKGRAVLAWGMYAHQARWGGQQGQQPLLTMPPSVPPPTISNASLRFQ